MAKAYWISCYRSVKNPDALAAYAKLAAPAIQAGGGRFLARDTPAIATHDSLVCQAARKALGIGAERDIRIVGGLG
jgi:uncharacterized protein (DUF1330 family)